MGTPSGSAASTAAQTTLKVPFTYTLGQNGTFVLGRPTLPFSALPATQFALAGTLKIPLGTRLGRHHQLQLTATVATFMPNGVTGFQQPSKTGIPLPAVYYHYLFDEGVDVFLGIDPSADKISAGISNVKIFNKAQFDATVNVPLNGQIANVNSTLALKIPVWRGVNVGAQAAFNGDSFASGQVTAGGNW